MDNILDLFNPKKPFSITMPCPSSRKQIVKGMAALDKELCFRPCSNLSKEAETEYIKEYRKKDDEEYLKMINDIIYNKGDYLDNISEITTSSGTVICKKDTAQIYRTYNFTYRPKMILPVSLIRDKIVNMIASNSAIIICGQTGCGKTTQIPQLILDAEYKTQRHCNIIVTQPRRIAALSIAKRVSQEREWPIGTLVGYQMGLIKNICRDTRITYCTTGVLLHKLINKKHMMEYTHVILDEIHERDEDMDFLLLVVKKLLRTNSPTVKVILMSATIDVDKFAEYFSTPVGNKLVPAPVIEIPEENPFNISIYYLDEIDNLGIIPTVNVDEPGLTPAMIEFCIRIMYTFNRIDKKGNIDITIYTRYTVLIFLPGIQEIEELRSVLSSPKHADAKWDIIILHSLISTEHQEHIFNKPCKGYRRIILSTNIAESSITVPDVSYIIDFCLTKILVTESETNYQCLKLCWASKANCQQRAGRTGRVMDGRVYRLVPKAFYNDVLDQESIPEMLRAPLANIILKTKVLDMGEPKALLALSLDPPNLSNIQSTILLLKEVGALLNKRNIAQSFDGDLTALGHIMSSLPLNVYVSKLIVLGHIFGVLHDAIIIGASMTVKDMFNIGLYQAASTYNEKLNWSAKSDSDCIAYLNAFKVWRSDKANRRIINNRTEREWARRRCLRVKALREVDALVADITQKLRYLGIKEEVGANKETWDDYHVDRTFIIKVIIAGAFYPNYFVKFPRSVEFYKKNIEKTLSNNDPRKTVCIRGWPINQPGLLYAEKIKQIFAEHMKLKNSSDLTVSFDDLSNIYVEHKNAQNDLFIRNAIKMRQCRIPIKIDLSTDDTTNYHAKQVDFTNKDYTTQFFDASSSNIQTVQCTQIGNDKSKQYRKYPIQRNSVVLDGPISPLEIELIHLPSTGKSKTVNIETTSVNSVLLDTYPDATSRRLLIAQIINRHSKRETHLTLRNTTLLPDMPGLTSLIILIFTPYMELRRDPLRTYYTGALCGLGYDSIGESIYREHDIESLFDVEITIEDLRKINILRHWMNVAMELNDDFSNDQSEVIIGCQNQIKKAFTEVVYKSRNKQDPVWIYNFHRWNRYDETLFLEPARETSKINNVYGLHKALELNEKNEELENMIKHLVGLESLASQDPNAVSVGTVYCKLCLTKVNGIINLRVHLQTKQHKTRKDMLFTSTGLEEDLENIMTNVNL